MKKIDYDAFYNHYWSIESENDKHNLLKNFMLSLSFEELKGWNAYLFEGIDEQININLERGLTEEDRAFYEKQFAQFDNLAEQIQLKKAA